jgi:hypothetical protein
VHSAMIHLAHSCNAYQTLRPLLAPSEMER